MLKRLIPALILASVLVPVRAQEKIDPTIHDKIRQEEEQHSQIMRTLHVLTDVYGPRVTGSPSLKAAGEWAIKTMTSWGFTNGHLEPWDFGHPGWTNDYLSVNIVSPVKGPLVAQTSGWTSGTPGPVRAKAINLVLPQGPLMPASESGRGGRGGEPQHLGPTEGEFTRDLNSVQDPGRSKI